MPRRRYVLTDRAASDLREARAWSLGRWGKELTNRYFDDLHTGAQFIAENHAALRGRSDLAGGTTLSLYRVREHYIVYEPLGDRFIAIVTVIRQGRDIPSILRKWATPIQRELTEIRARLRRGEIALPTRAGRDPRRRK